MGNRNHVIDMAQSATVDVSNPKLCVLERIEVDGLYISEDLNAQIMQTLITPLAVDQ